MKKINIALLTAVLIASLVASAAYGFIENSSSYEGGAYCQRGTSQCQLHEASYAE